MRFITEFELTSRDWLNMHRSIGASEIGDMIVNYFGWQERGVTTPHSPVAERHTLEIEAFPMDKWIEFKNRLLSHIHFCNDEDTPVDEIRVLQLIKDLEFHDTKKESSK